MIFGASNHPVEVKRIKVNVWGLKDEIEHVITKRFAEKPDLTPEERNKIISEVTFLFTPHAAKEINIDPGQALKLVETPAEKTEAATTPPATEAKPEDATKAEEPKAEDAKAAEANSEAPKAEGEQPAAEAKAEGPKLSVVPVAGEEAKESAGIIEFRKRPDMRQNLIKQGILFLADVNMNHIAFFSQKSFIPGQNIVIEFDIPHSFIVSAEVISCRNYNLRSKIISSVRPDFRIYAKFTFSMPGERTQLRSFVKSIEPTVPKPKKKKPKEDADAGAEGGADDDLSKLGV